MIARTLIATTVATALQLVAPSAAWAETICNKKTDPVYATARPHFDRGLKLFAEGAQKNDPAMIADAERELLLAYRVCATVGVTFNLAQLEAYQRRPLPAMRHMREGVRINDGKAPEDSASEPNLGTEFNKLWVSLLRATAHFTLETAADAEIFIDGDAWPVRAPLREPVDVEAGTHTIEVRLGDRRASRTVQLANGEEQHVRVALPAPPVPTPTKTVEVAAPTPTAKVVLVSTLATLGAVGVLGGFYFASEGAAAQSEADALRLPPSCAGVATGDCLRAGQLRDDKNRDQTLGIVSFVTGGALLGAAVLTAVLWKPRPEGTRVVPIVGPGSAGLGVAKSF